MALTVTATISQSSDGTQVVFLDTTTGVVGLVSRTLSILDANGVLLQQINMGATLTATYVISTDLYLQFVEVIVDNSGTSTGQVNFLSTAFYELAFAPAIAAQICPCDDLFGVLYNLNQSNLYATAAQIFAERGIGPQAQAMITQANFLVSTPYYA